jgi:sigma-E factor negative regulatory protein RseC
MNSTDCIEQKGIIEEISNGTAKVHVTSLSACASCATKGACHAGESANKTVEVFIGDQNYHKGELVNIRMNKTLGFRATLLAYILPFFVLLITLIILTELEISEVISGLLSLAVLVPYFLILYLKKDKLQKTFQFTLNKVI